MLFEPFDEEDHILTAFISQENFQKIISLNLNKNIRVLKYPENASDCYNQTHDEKYENINYAIKYDKILKEDYIHRKGEDSFIYTKTEVIAKQRAVSSYLIKKIGSNLLKGRSIMNISLPINIFDSRTLLEQWVWQNGISSQIFQSLNPNLSPIEKLKFSTCYAISKFYLTGAPLKPFNPILGETFQAKLNDSTYYLEQTSHHPCIMNFYAVQPYNTIYGYEQADASTSANSVTVHYKGKLTVEFKDKTKNVIVYPTILLNGTMLGTRKLCFKRKMCVYDRENDLISVIAIAPSENDKRNIISKMLFNYYSKDLYPDYFKGGIYRISELNIRNFSCDMPDKINIEKNAQCLSEIEGEFMSYINFDKRCYWRFGEKEFPQMKRDTFTLPSDSCYRDDLIWFRENDLELSQRFKVFMEEKQRKDKSVRERKKL